jgi:hypothetical protein
MAASASRLFAGVVLVLLELETALLLLVAAEGVFTSDFVEDFVALEGVEKLLELLLAELVVVVEVVVLVLLVVALARSRFGRSQSQDTAWSMSVPYKAIAARQSASRKPMPSSRSTNSSLEATLISCKAVNELLDGAAALPPLVDALLPLVFTGVFVLLEVLLLAVLDCDRGDCAALAGAPLLLLVVVVVETALEPVLVLVILAETDLATDLLSLEAEEGVGSIFFLLSFSFFFFFLSVPGGDLTSSTIAVLAAALDAFSSLAGATAMLLELAASDFL